MNRPDFRILEGIRGLAALVVMLGHSRAYLFIGGREYVAQSGGLFDKLAIGLFQVTSPDLSAVIVFFVLSGFSIAHSVETGGSASRFYSRRVIRLVPPCLGGLALAGLAYLATAQPPSFRAFVPQYWSLYQEAIFYAMAPLVVAMAWRLHFVAAATVGYLAGWALGDGEILHNFVFQYAFYFAVGIVAYHRRDLLQRLAMGRQAFALAVVVGYGALIVTVPWPRVASFIAAVYALLLICNFQHHRLSNRPLQVLGNMSYTLYVTHYATIVLWALLLQKVGLQEGRTSASLWLWMTAVPVCLAVSYAFYLALERPTMGLLRRMRERRVLFDLVRQQ